MDTRKTTQPQAVQNNSIGNDAVPRRSKPETAELPILPLSRLHKSKPLKSKHLKTNKVIFGSSKAPKSGEVVAALAAIILGMAALTAAQWWSAADPAHANLVLLRLGSWLPSGLRIGPYAGKEMSALIIWLGSWAILFLLLRHFELGLKPWLYTFFGVVLIILLLLWPPIYHQLYGWPA